MPRRRLELPYHYLKRGTVGAVYARLWVPILGEGTHAKSRFSQMDRGWRTPGRFDRFQYGGDKAWENASLVEEREDRARDVNIASIKRFVAPLLLDGEMATAYLTIKESMEHGHRIYSLELQEIKIPTV